MHYEFDLLKTENQMFNTNIGDNNFEFDMHTFRGIIYMNVKINGVLADLNVVALPNKSLFNKAVNKAAGGVFKFKCLSDDYPSCEQFDGITSVFCFYPDGES